jgi:phosphopantothenoylcysteine decarboxylase/phosphopantothenate--cysteine ligase
LSNKEVVLAVTGSIAAYKACEIASRLVELGVRVTPVLTASAQEFVGAASFEAITGTRAITRLFEPLQNPDVEHIAVATRADLFLVAPASANVIAKAAHGLADDWLSTTLLATRAPILMAPAMNSNMYEHPATQANMATLRGRGVHFIGPGAGRLACGTVGIGRMLDPAMILEAALPLLSTRRPLAGKRILITSGGTREPLDPVRYLGNRSSGKMGRALAMAALSAGADVVVVSGPTEVSPPCGVERIDVETAREMAEAVQRQLESIDVMIAAAAVADFRPAETAEQKRKRSSGPFAVELIENPDVLAGAVANRREGQLFVGFAAETENVLEHARHKLRQKGVDLIVGNHVGTPASGFGTESLAACIVGRDGDEQMWEDISKTALADEVMDRIAALLRVS